MVNEQCTNLKPELICLLIEKLAYMQIPFHRKYHSRKINLVSYYSEFNREFVPYKFLRNILQYIILQKTAPMVIPSHSVIKFGYSAEGHQ